MVVTESAPEPTLTLVGPGPARPIRVRRIEGRDVLMVGGSALSALALTWLVYERLTPLSGALGFWVCWYLTFLAMTGTATVLAYDAVRARDRIATVVLWSVGIGVIPPLLPVVGYTITRGIHALRIQFFLEDQRYVGALSRADEGGGRHAIIGTLQQVGLAALISVPIGILTAVYLSEVRGRLTRPLRMVTDAMSAIPSIVAGLFIYALWILTLGNQQSGFAGALALSVLFLPTVTRTSEVVLGLVPGGLREASLALGGTEWRTTTRVVLPTARTGLTTAVILGVARVIGETAPLILTIGGAFVVNSNPFDGKQDALPYFVYRLVRFPQPAQIQRAWTGALVLLFVVLALFVIARTIGGRGPDHISRFRRFRLRRKGLA
ncbi:MAG: phosphate ABC transporter permease PstA [Actinomycetota bacterium]